MKNEIKIGVLLSYSSIIISTFISILYTPVMLNILGKSEYGLYQLVYSIVSYLGLLSFGFDSAYFKYFSKYKALNDTENIKKTNSIFLIIFSVIGIISLVAGIFLVLNADSILASNASANEIRTAKILILFMVINIAFNFPAIVFSSNIAANEKFIFLKLLDVIKALLNPMISFPLLLLGYQSIGLVLATTLINFIGIFANIYYAFKKTKIKFVFKNLNFTIMKDIFNFTFFIFLAMITDQINWNIDKLMLGKLLGTISVAIYSIGAQLNTYFLNIFNIITNIYAPRINLISTKENAKISLEEIFIKVSRIQTVLMLFVLGGFICVGKYFIINIWAGVDYENSYLVAVILMTASSIQGVQSIGIVIQRVLNKHKFSAFFMLGIALLHLIISFVLINNFYEIGAAITTFVTMFLGFGVFMTFYYEKVMKINILKIYKNLLPLIFIFLCATLPLCGIIIFFPINSHALFAFYGILYSLSFILLYMKFGINESELLMLKDTLSKFKKKEV
ncbi:oligosaccharide flippase family protein [Amedibacillus sp. YH-ame10]